MKRADRMTIPMDCFPWLTHRTMAEVAETEALLARLWQSECGVGAENGANKRLINLANRVPYRPDHVRRIINFDDFWRRPLSPGDAA